jgi:NTE family protein
MSAKAVAKGRAERPKIVLVLQGGGALGAYHIGAYQALAEHDLHPDWICGISIGAINSAVLAGNPPETRLERLAEFWHAISWPDLLGRAGVTAVQTLFNTASNVEALVFGQPNFFAPRLLNPLLIASGAPQAMSFYDTTPLLFTLRRFADFERINSRVVRLSLGATNIATGDLEFFDTNATKIGPEHVLASGSLPPGFPATAVGNGLYWDGGCVSNTPLQAVLDDLPKEPTVVFMVDLWDPAGKPPTTMNEVQWREKQIQYASRTSHHIEAVATAINLRHAVRLLKQAGAPEVAAVPEEVLGSTGPRIDIVHITYRPGADQIPNSDAEFSRASIGERRDAGYADMKAALDVEPWLRPEKPAHLGAMMHRVENGRVTTLPEPHLAKAPHPVDAAAAPAGRYGGG